MVIKIKSEYKELLYLLFPDYDLVESIQQPEKFIVERDIKSEFEKYQVSQFKDCIVISNVIFEEEWNEERLCKEALEFRRKAFKSRKKTLSSIVSLQGQDFVQALKDFITTGQEPLGEEQTIEILSSVGSRAFTQDYMNLIQKMPEAKVRAAVMTFLSKLRSGSVESIFYKKKSQQLLAPITRNFTRAVQNYNRTEKDSLAFCNFVVELTTT